MTEQKTRVRASTLNRLAVCPAALAQSEGKPDITEPYGALGKAFHDAMAQAAINGRNSVSIGGIASTHGVSEAELGALWNRFTFDPSEFPGAAPELDVAIVGEQVTISGRIDLVLPFDAEKRAQVIDYKSGHRIDEDPEPWADCQTQAYGIGWMEAHPEHERVECMKAYPRRGDDGWSSAFVIDATNREAVRNRLLGIALRAVQQRAKPEGQRSYGISHHCDWCPGRIDCPALRVGFAMAVNATKDLATLTKSGKPSRRTETVFDVEVTVENVPMIHGLARQIRKALGAIDAALKAFVRTFGPIELDAGKYLAFRTFTRAPSLTGEALHEAARDLGWPEEWHERIDTLLGYAASRPREEYERMDVYGADALAREEESK